MLSYFIWISFIGPDRNNPRGHEIDTFLGARGLTAADHKNGLEAPVIQCDPLYRIPGSSPDSVKILDPVKTRIAAAAEF